jgi:non-ribosomal peptide synthetase-like protein
MSTTLDLPTRESDDRRRRGAHAATTSVPDLVLVDDTVDHTIRWTRGERFHHVFEHVVDDLVAHGLGDTAAVDLDGATLSFVELDQLANGLARRLAASGVRAGSRVGLLFERSAHPYIAMLAVSKLHAAWVPLDPGFPADRIQYICGDAGVDTILTQPQLLSTLTGVGVRTQLVDEHEVPGERLTADEVGDPADDLAYIVYTSGTTGRPKGVGIEHSAICNFVRVAAEHYGYRRGDRVYQGLTIAFDFSIEEIWVPLAAGATLVPAPPSVSLVGPDLAEFLLSRQITALCCVPTLLATLDDDVPDLRLVLVSGEACPEDLVRRWYAPHRRFLNLYGPTETTVTATWTSLVPDEPVTIGVPLPTYSVVVVDPVTHDPLPFGEEGVIAVAGIGLSPGYIGRDDLTANAFVPDPLGLPGNPSGRLYLTGDLGRVNRIGRIEYRGRVDTQVKVRGYRIELVEIESALMEHPDVAQAAVTTHLSDSGEKELAAFYTVRPGHDEIDADDVMRRLRERLPPFMVPVYLERLDGLPVQTSGKVDRTALPAPSVGRYIAGGAIVPPEGAIEEGLASAMARTLGLPQVSVTAHFFSDLGADSLRMAQFCAAVRADDSLPAVTTKEVYLNPTIRQLAAALGTAPAGALPVVPMRLEPHVASRAAYIATGAAQVATFLVYVMIIGWFVHLGYDVLTSGEWWDTNLAAVAVTAGGVVTTLVLPLVVKWTVIGRWTAEPIRVWSLRYYRYWIVRAFLSMSPARLLVGSPAYNVYLRMLGMRIGKHALILTSNPPVFTDLVTIGEGTVIRAEVALDAYKAERGWIVPGRIDIGAHSFIGESSILDIDTRMGDRASLAHASALLPGQEIPSGRSWHGSPALDAGPYQPPQDDVRVSTFLRMLYGAWQVVGMIVVTSQIAVAFMAIAVAMEVTKPLNALAFTLAMIVLSGIIVLTVPRLAALPLRPGRVYRLYGMYWSLFKLTVRTSNSAMFNNLFGDSSAILHYLRAIGIRFPNPVQTGSNFGTAQSHHVPTLCTVGGGSLVSDGLAMPNGEFTTHGFRVREIVIGERVFMGNGVVYPPAAALGDDVLLATKVMVPIDGPVRSGVGLLGSPAFEIPRTVARDTRFDHLREGEAFRRGLRAKNWHNFRTALIFIAIGFLGMYAGLGTFFTLIEGGPLGVVTSVIATILITFAIEMYVDAAVRGFKPLSPQYCSIYDVTFWRHERYWKVSAAGMMNMFNGTPFKALTWRLFGVRVGTMLFDDGAVMPERTLVTVGDNVTFAAGTVLNGHSLEDGTFKSGYIKIGSNVSIGPGTVVHYGTDVGDGAMVTTDGFLMKGERAEPGSVWEGNPSVLIGKVGPAESSPRVLEDITAGTTPERMGGQP